MIIKRIVLENIRSYIREEITFPEGSILLSGDIGSGKTTILLGIEFGLFGLQPGQKGSSILRHTADEGRVILECEIEDKNIILERTLKRGNKSVTQEYAAITINSEKFEESVTEIKNRVLTLLHYPSEFAKKTNVLYKFTVYTPQEEMKQIILEPGDMRLNTLRHVFGIDKYKRIEENLNTLLTKLREKIRINEGIISDLEHDKKNFRKKKEQRIELKETQRKTLSKYNLFITDRIEKEKDLTEILKKNDERKSFETEKSKSEVLLSEKTKNMFQYEKIIKGLIIQIDEAKKTSFNEEEYAALQQRFDFQEQKEGDLQKEYIEIISEINSNESKKKEITDFKRNMSTMHECPTCLQHISEEYKRNIHNKTEEETKHLQKNLNDFSKRKNELIEKLEQVKKQKEELKKRKAELELLRVKRETITEKEQRIIENETMRKKLEEDIQLLKKHTESLDKTIGEFEKYTIIFEEKNKELTQLQSKENEYAIKQAEINKEIQFIDQQIEEKMQQIEKKEQLRKKIDHIRELEYWMSEKFIPLVLFTEKQVMLTLKEEFSTLFSKWFSILVSDTLSAKLNDEFSPIIEQQDYELDYGFLSGGERTAIALAYRLALNQVINSLLSNIKTGDLVILDEPTDGFSSTQLDKMRDVLTQLKVAQLILVSHEQKIEGFVDNVIRLRKREDVTEVVN